MTRRMLTREQALNWNPDWSYTDREIIEQNLNRLNAQTYYVPPSGGYVGCIDVNGSKVMTLYAGYVEFKLELAPDDRPEPEWPGLLLSTFRPQTSPSRRELTGEQALKWNPDWSYTDREIIEQNVNRLNAQTFYVPPSGGYVGCIDVQGRIVMTLHAGYVEFKPELAPDDRREPEWPGLALSTFRPHASPIAAPREGTEVCPIHHIALPVTGICDECQ